MFLKRNRHCLLLCEKKRLLVLLGLAFLMLSLFIFTKTTAIAGEFNITNNTYQDGGPAVSGNRVVWRTCSGSYPDCDVYLYDFATGTQEKISTAGFASGGAYGGVAISGNTIVWGDMRNPGDANDIWMFNFPEGPETRITFHDSEQYDPDVSGDYIVYESSAGTTANWGIYLYVISTGQEIEIAVDPSAGIQPAISGKRIVYVQDEDIYMYDFSTTTPDTGIKTQITNDGAAQSNPDISGMRIVWEDNRHGQKEIYLYDLSESAPVEKRITTSTADQRDPAISGDYVVWCSGEDYNIYKYDLSTMSTIKISTSGRAERPDVSGERIVWEDGWGSERDILLYDPGTNLPSAEMTEPSNTQAAPIDTKITIHVRDSLSGVDQSTIKMTVESADVTPPPDGGPLDYTLIYALSLSEPPSKYERPVTVTVEASDQAGNPMSESFSFITEAYNGNPLDPGLDTDGDGITDYIEVNILYTNENKKTLFVKPSMPGSTPNDIYWEAGEFNGKVIPLGFEDLLPLSPFKNADIEIVVIGDDNNPYPPMRNYYFNPKGFEDEDPVTGTPIPIPCNILEIRYMGETTHCTWIGCEVNEGHTHFVKDTVTWSPNQQDWIPTTTWAWDTKGYTPQESNIKSLYGYYKPRIYPFMLHNYFTEGAYTSITVGEIPDTTKCTTNDCDMLTHSDHFSPMNLNDDDYMIPPIFGKDTQGNILDYGTVEFNSIVFCKEDELQGTYQCSEEGEICNVAPEPRGTTGYTWEEVLRRTVVHEMGHALMTAFGDRLGSEDLGDHCENPNCIMCAAVVDWKMHNFGSGPTEPGSCPHQAGGSKDIRKLIYNEVHP